MGTRLELQSLLETLLGSRNVYYQPPSTIQMKYPAIVYSRDDFMNDHANNGVYAQTIGYAITVISKNPDEDVVKKIAKLPMCTFDRHYVADNLNHDVFTLYF